MASVGTGSQNRESSSALVPPSVLPGLINTEPVENQEKIKRAHIVLEKEV